MKYYYLFLAVLMFSTAATSQSVNDKRITELEPELEKLLGDWKTAGFAVAVVEKNQIIYANGFGYRDVEKKLPVTPGTLFAIGSCTKAFTSSLIGLLNNEKRVDLDKPVHQYVPGLNFFNTGMTNNVSLRDLMSHRTGLPRHDFSWYLFPTTRDSLLQRIQFMEPTAGVRDRWQYNNFMFLLQGIISEKVTGQSWEQQVKNKLLSPLGMTRTNFSVMEMAKDKDASLGYDVKKDSIISVVPYYNIDAMGPAGSINSSVTEMSNWVISWINNGKFQNKEILPSFYVREAMSSQMVIAPALPDKEVPDVHFSNYGFGWFLASYRGHYRVEHGGNIDGFSASTCFYPTDSIGIIVLSNQNNSPVPGLVRNIISDKLLKLPPSDWNGRRKKSAENAKRSAAIAKNNMVNDRKRGTKPSHPLQAYTGVFSHPGYGSLDIFVKQDSLFFRTPKELIWLKHYHYDIFEPYGVDPKTGIDTTNGTGLKIQFQTDVKGDITYLSAGFEPALDPLKFTRKEKEVKLMESALQKYAGEYELAGTTAKVYTKSNRLYCLIPGQPEYELTAVGNDKFTIPIPGYSMQFHPEAGGKIAAVSFMQPNGTFRAERKR